MLCLLFLTAPHTFAEDYNTVLDRLGRLQALANSYVETEDSSADPIVLTPPTPARATTLPRCGS